MTPADVIRNAIPDGFALVPVEPTDKMIEAARAECHRMRGVIDPVMHIWDVMLAAAIENANGCE